MKKKYEKSWVDMFPTLKKKCEQCGKLYNPLVEKKHVSVNVCRQCDFVHQDDLHDAMVMAENSRLLGDYREDN